METKFDIQNGDAFRINPPDKLGDIFYTAQLPRGEYLVKIEWTNTRFPYCSLEITKDGHTVWADNECEPPGWEGNTLEAFIEALDRDFTIEDLFYINPNLNELQWDHMDSDRQPLPRP